MYGAQWLDKWEGADLDLVRGQWAATLDRFDDACMKQALDSMLADGERFPPSLPEFFKRCSAFRPVGKRAPLYLAGPRAVAPDGIFDKIRKQIAKGEPVTQDEE